MNNEAFMDLVKRMRQAQKNYFRDRKPSDLLLSKQLEMAVDTEVKLATDPDNQTKLF